MNSNGRRRAGGRRSALVLGITLGCVQLAGAPGGKVITPLSLDGFYSSPINLKSWVAVPQGIQTLQDVPFQINGYIELASARTINEGGSYFLEAGGIPIRQKFSRLHLLHFTEYAEQNGKAIVQVFLFYANGERRMLTVRYGVHVLDWYGYAGDRHGSLRDPDSKVAWTGETQDAAQYNKIVRLYQTAFENPLPDQPVTRLDFISEMSSANPVIVAVSLEQNPSAKQQETLFQPENPAQFDSLRIRTVDAEGENAVSNARIRITAKSGPANLVVGEFRTGEQGIVDVLYHQGRLASFALTVAASTYMQSIAGFVSSGTNSLPKEVTLKLLRGVKIGGTVIDASSHPIPGVTIVIRGIVNDADGQFSLADLDTVTSDAKGRWSSTSLAADFKDLTIALSCAGFADREYEQEPSDSGSPLVVSKAELLAGAATMKMERSKAAGVEPVK